MTLFLTRYCIPSFQHGGAFGGNDMKVTSVWARGITGRGVVVSILDDGIERNHTDLVMNYVSTQYVIECDVDSI